MYQLNIWTPSCMKASLPVSADVAHYLENRLIEQEIKRDELMQIIGYPVGIGGQGGSFLNSVYNFANAILKESNSATFHVQIEAIPAHSKLNPIFHSIKTLPEHGREIIVVFDDKEIMSGVEYCKKHEKFHSRRGSLKEERIHQWAYANEFYEQLQLPQFPKRKEVKSEVPELLKLLILAAVMSDKSETERSKKTQHPIH
ncbi:hypothetical protein [Acinetobacter tandoii]|uniref:Uncharacterized protein n=1 Tax=Acinetobacter tandoii DSM 14970 = CIP 107469 TaxID=1120927 RepID=R9AS39_9GAMM|nr:hypothetical protein [Acinetobacter tandoii]EOR05008.1 hypothetical protein I593_03092 [Acinetobacter tandoii DSM 14970 = CIP 107469]